MKYILILSLFIVGCGFNNPNIQSSAASNHGEFDLNCPHVSVQPLGGDLYGVRGCGKSAIYNLNGACSKYSNCEASLEGEIKKDQ